jgi:hypothetical protein
MRLIVCICLVEESYSSSLTIAGLGVIGYLESSEAGQQLYRSFGFEPIREILFDTRPFGGDRTVVHTVRKLLRLRFKC